MEESTIQPDLNFQNIEYDEYTSDSEIDSHQIDFYEPRRAG